MKPTPCLTRRQQHTLVALYLLGLGALCVFEGADVAGPVLVSAVGVGLLAFFGGGK